MKIAYSVNGNGLGHAVRTERIVTELKERRPDLEFLIFSYSDSLDYLWSCFRDDNRVSLREIWPIEPVMKYGKILVGKTSLVALKHLTKMKKRVKSLTRLIEEENCQLIISDLEPFLVHAARAGKMPSLCINNSGYLRYADIKLRELPRGQRLPYMLARMVIEWISPVADTNIITTFYDGKWKKRKWEDVRFFGPMIKRDVVESRDRVRDDGFILVYPKHPNERVFLKTLLQIPEIEFRVYAKDTDLREKASRQNIQLNEICKEKFLYDLLSCRLVLSTAGHQLPIEAEYLAKPILLVPEKGQFEQWHNAYIIENNGYGVSLTMNELNPEAVRRFYLNIDKYKERLEKADIRDSTPKIIDIILDKVSEIEP